MWHKAVVGLGFGDEGKGRVVDWLCSHNHDSLVIRYSGGQQAGHTVEFNGTRHVFSNFGSGTLRERPTYWSAFCSVDPQGICNEYDLLLSKNIMNPSLWIDLKAPITTPYDKWHNIRRDSVLNHGTCGVGVGSTFDREEHHYHLLAEDLLYMHIFKLKLEEIREYYKFKEKPEVTEKFLGECKRMLELVELTDSTIMEDYEELIFEGSQGLMLDQNFGIFPHVTRSSTGKKNIQLLSSNVIPYLVTRCYETRHGNGPMTGIELGDVFVEDILETNVTNEFQGPFRKRMLNLDTLQYALDKGDFLKTSPILVITCFDHIKAKYSFSFNGKPFYHTDIKDYCIDVANKLNIRTVYYSDSPSGDLTLVTR